MKKQSFALLLFGIGICAAAAFMQAQKNAPVPSFKENTAFAKFTSTPLPPETALKDKKPIPNYIGSSIAYLVEAQAPNGGWGAGLNSRQDIVNPHEVQTDPATTAFVGMALLKLGNTLENGAYRDNLKNATEYLLTIVEETPENSHNVNAPTGTQIQSKLGQNIDVAMTSQFLTRLKTIVNPQSPVHKRIDSSIRKCVKILENAQQQDGSWSTSGWAPVLNSAMANNALEMAKDAGVAVDEDKLRASQRYQRSNLDEKGEVKTDRSAGVKLYSASSSQRANTKLSKKAEQYLSAPTTKSEELDVDDIQRDLEKNGAAQSESRDLAEAVVAYNQASRQMERDDVLSGFGNNGGEEFLSYMMTSESYVEANDNNWDKWHTKMSGLFEKIQNKNGSWSGHHCITSPVFCTAAVIMTLTADR